MLVVALTYKLTHHQGPTGKPVGFLSGGTMIKQPTKKKTVKKTDPSDLQAPIDVAPESAMQVKEPFITPEMEEVYETAPKPDPNFIPRIPCNDPPKVVEEIPRKNPNGDPFDTMYARQRKAQ